MNTEYVGQHDIVVELHDSNNYEVGQKFKLKAEHIELNTYCKIVAVMNMKNSKVLFLQYGWDEE